VTRPERRKPARNGQAPLVVEVVSHSPDETRRLGRRLGRALDAGDIVLLEGTLGAGKTVFAQGVAAGLGVEGPVTSPTFTLIHEHAGRAPLYHVDLYRLPEAPGAGEGEAADIGLEEYLGGDGVAVIEWGARAPGLVPPDHLVVELSHVPERGERTRRIRIWATGERHRRPLEALAPGGPERGG
jgi:tRNA threonylcarbamoyladenosine biosynthesis protein TsaE